MHYQVSRNGQTYGPYTLDDLRRYVASGNVLPTDLCKSDEMPDFLPVSQVLGQPPHQTSSQAPSQAPGQASGYAGTAPTPGDPAPYAQPGYGNAAASGMPAQYPGAYPAAALAQSPFPDAPNLGWGWYLVLTLLTCGLFSKVFFLIQSAWLKRIQPNSTALFLNIGVLVMDFAGIFTGIAAYRTLLLGGGNHMNFAHISPGSSIVSVLHLVLLIWGRFAFSSAMEEHFRTVEPIGLEMNPVLTFFFGGIYFQSVINRVNAMKQAARFGAGRAY